MTSAVDWALKANYLSILVALLYLELEVENNEVYAAPVAFEQLV